MIPSTPYHRGQVFIAACAGLLIFGMTLITLGSILPTLITRFESNGLNKSYLVALLPIGILLGSLVFGPIVDRYGYKLLLIVSVLLSIAALEGLAIAQSNALIYWCIFSIGFGGGIINGGTSALVSDISSEHKGANLSLLGTFYGVGAVGMPLLLGLLGKLYDYTSILAAIGICMLLPVVYFSIIRFPAPKHSQGFPVQEGLKLVKNPALLLISFYLFFQSGTESLSNNFMTSYLQDKLSIDNQQALFALSFSVVGLTLSRLTLGGLLKKIESHKVVYTSLSTVVAGCILLMVANTYWLAFPGILLIGIGLGAGFPVMLGYLGQLFPTLSGTAFSIALVIALTGNTLINYSYGELSKTMGIHTLPATILFYAVLMIILFYIILRNKLTSSTN